MDKVCSKCGLTKDLSSFSKLRGGTRPDCKSCQSSYAKKYYHKNKERIRENQAKYVNDNREKLHESNRRRYHENKEKYTATNKEWRGNNTDKINASSAKRHAQKLKAMPSWLSDQDKESIKSIYSLCRKLTQDTGVDHHVDHIVPLRGDNVCGLHVHWNLQVVTAEENISKGNKHDDWG